MCKNPSVSILMRLHDKKILIRETCMIQTVHICYNSVIKHVHIWGVIWHMQQNVIKCSMVQLPQFSYTYWLIHFNSDSENCNDMKSWIVGWWLQRMNLQCKNGMEYNKKIMSLWRYVTMVFEIYKISRMITKSYGTNCNQKYSLVQTLMPQMKTDLTYITSNQKIKISFSFPHSFHTFNKKWAKTFIYPKLFFLAETFFWYTQFWLFFIEIKTKECYQ